MATEDGDNQTVSAANISIAKLLEAPLRDLHSITGTAHQSVKPGLELVCTRLADSVKSADFRIAYTNKRVDAVNKSHAQTISQLTFEAEKLRRVNKSQSATIWQLERALGNQNMAANSHHNVVKDLLSSIKEREAALGELSDAQTSNSDAPSPKGHLFKKRRLEDFASKANEFVSSAQNFVDTVAKRRPSDPVVFHSLFDFLSFMPDLMAALDMDTICCAERHNQRSIGN